jgi:hypothetical protein
MSNSTPIIDTIPSATLQPEVAANDLFNAVSPGMLFGNRPQTTGSLTWGYFGGVMMVDGALTAIANGTVTLTASSTNYVEATRAGVVSANTTAYTPGRIPLYRVVTTTLISSWTDDRAWVQPHRMVSSGSVAVTSADVTLNAQQAACRYLTTTGVLTGNRNVVVPDYWEGIVFCNNTGAFTTTFKTTGGTGIVVAQTKRAILLGDGTNVVRITADV